MQTKETVTNTVTNNNNGILIYIDILYFIY